MAALMLVAQAGGFPVRALGELLIIVLVACAVWYVFSLIAAKLAIPAWVVQLVGVLAAVVAGIFVIRFLMNLL